MRENPYELGEAPQCGRRSKDTGPSGQYRIEENVHRQYTDELTFDGFVEDSALPS